MDIQWSMSIVDISNIFMIKDHFEDVLEDVFGPPSRTHIGGCDGPCAVGHAKACAQVFGEMNMAVISFGIQDLIVF